MYRKLEVEKELAQQQIASGVQGTHKSQKHISELQVYCVCCTAAANAGKDVTLRVCVCVCVCIYCAAGEGLFSGG